jgi:hypothetical protein
MKRLGRVRLTVPIRALSAEFLNLGSVGRAGPGEANTLFYLELA